MPQHDIVHQCACAVALASEPDETRRRSWTRLASSKLGAVDPNTTTLSASGGDVARSTLQDFIASAAALDAVPAATHLFRRCLPHRILGRHASHQWVRLERHLALGMLAACSKLSFLSTAQNFLPLRGLTRWRLVAQEICLMGRRGRESRSGNACRRRIEAARVLIPKIQVRTAWDTLEGRTPNQSATSRRFDRCAERQVFS